MGSEVSENADVVVVGAGSDTANLWPGFIDGAVERALHTSRDITETLTPHLTGTPAGA